MYGGVLLFLMGLWDGVQLVVARCGSGGGAGGNGGKCLSALTMLQGSSVSPFPAPTCGSRGVSILCSLK